MPVSPRPPSLLDERPGGISLLPGEDHVRLRSDPYYGMVEIGTRGTRQPEPPRVRGERLQREVEAGAHLLDGEEQNFIEVMTGKRLQQKDPGERPEVPPDAEAPTLTALVPDSAVIGEPSFTLKVQGTNFVDGSVIVFNGFDEPTTFVSATEVTTGVNMDVWAAQSLPLPVNVRNPDGDISNDLMFIFNETGAAGTGRKTEAKAEPKKK